MYAVVGCTDCGTYWLLSDPDAQDSATCPRCGATHEARKLRRFFESDDRSEAAQARARLLAEKRGEREAFDRAGTVEQLEREAEEAGIDDREYLEGSGIDADEVSAAGDTGGGRSKPRDEIVRDALRDGPVDEDDVVDYATDRGVPASAARDLLNRLTRRGEATETGGEYRLL
ncbi:DUF5817 domain-containing protein [Halobaculum sp. P14]|uniref:DUF5817 domain-containing protein n=1 Tax=Halobaculum sp. P14 TaxID=3421638 RepID=UPI003EB8A4B2